MRSNTVLTLTTVAALALFSLATPAQAGGVRLSATHPETGDAGVVRAGYNPETGARWSQARGYDASTNTYAGTTRAYNPATGEGFTTSTTAAEGSGITTVVNTVNNGSYECSVSRDLPAFCAEMGE